MTDVHSILFLGLEKQRKEGALPVWRKAKDKEMKRFIFSLVTETLE
jgi:hypothetical protein